MCWNFQFEYGRIKASGRALSFPYVPWKNIFSFLFYNIQILCNLRISMYVSIHTSLFILDVTMFLLHIFFLPPFLFTSNLMYILLLVNLLNCVQSSLVVQYMFNRLVQSDLSKLRTYRLSNLLTLQSRNSKKNVSVPTSECECSRTSLSRRRFF